MSNANKKQPALEEVVLLRDHTHCGEKKQAGESIQVNQADKAWLIAHEIISADAANK